MAPGPGTNSLMATVRQGNDTGWVEGTPVTAPPSTPFQCCSQAAGPEAFLHLPSGCLAEQWSGKKGDIASLGGKKSKKKRGRVKGSSSDGGGSKQRKELGSLEEDANPDEEGVQKASPLPHSPPDEL